MASNISTVSSAAKEPADAIAIYRELLIRICLANGGTFFVPNLNLAGATNGMYNVKIRPENGGISMRLEKVEPH